VKRSAEEVEGGAAPEEEKAKKQKTEEEKPAAAPLKATAPAPAVVKKQVEYYFSDINLKHDKFFHNKISENPEGWLDLTLILQCNKMKAMQATKEDVFGALKDSELETKEDGANSFVRRKDNAKLPTLEARTGGPPSRHNKKQSNVHDGGVLFQVKGIPEEVTWLNVKEAMKDKLPEGASVWFVSSVNETGTCVVALSPFDKDVDFVSTELKIHLGGKDLGIEVCFGDALQQALKMLPKGHKERRDKAAKTRQKARQRPLQLGGQKFVNLNTLRGKVKEILNSRTDGEELKSGGPDYTLVRAIMEYHPAKERKLANMRGIKVDISEHGSSRCFWVLREEGKGNAEDFSIKKCIEAIERNPPYADAAPATPTGKAVAAGSTSASPKKEGTEEKKAESPVKVKEEEKKEEVKEEKKEEEKKDEDKKEEEKKEVKEEMKEEVQMKD